MYNDHKLLEDYENELMDINMCLDTALGECRKNLLIRKINTTKAIKRLEIKLGKNRRYIEEDNDFY